MLFGVGRYNCDEMTIFCSCNMQCCVVFHSTPFISVCLRLVS